GRGHPVAGAARLNARLRAGGFALALVLSACAGRPPHWEQPRVNPGPGESARPHEYTVRPGDTLYSIAFRNGLDWRDVARWNGIEGPGYLIRVGRKLTLTGSAASIGVVSSATDRGAESAAPAGAAVPTAVKFQWP